MADWEGLGCDDDNLDLRSLCLSASHLSNTSANGIVSLVSSPSKALQGLDVDAFCCRDNVNECMLYLNQELTAMARPSLFEGRSSKYDIVRVTNCLYDLVQRHHRSIRAQEEMQNRIHRMESDASHTNLVETRLKATLEQMTRKLSTEEERLRQCVNKNKLLMTKLKAEKEEVRRLQSEAGYRYTQFKHEMVKKEKELIRLKEHLKQLLSDKCQENKLGMEMSEILQRSDGKRGTWMNHHKLDDELQRGIISNYDFRQKEMMVENTGLRQCLTSCINTIHKEFANIIDDTSTLVHHTDTGDSESDVSLDSDVELINGQFDMPCDLITSKLERTIAGECRIMKRHVRRMSKTKFEDCCDSDQYISPASNQIDEDQQKQLGRLRQQTDRYRDIINQQDQLIQLQQGIVPALAAPVDNGTALEDMESLRLQRRLFLQEKEHFHDERHAFTEAAIRLGREREQFEKERASYMAKQIMHMTPFNKQSTKSLSPEKKYLPTDKTSVTPASNSKMSVQDGPSTPELYRALGIATREHTNVNACASPTLSDLSKIKRSPHFKRVAEHAQKIKLAVLNHDFEEPQLEKGSM